ncbi:MAG: hypothetical protein ABIH90_02570, partial [Candidatus Aenigmatarchaeota archaeon]
MLSSKTLTAELLLERWLDVIGKHRKRKNQGLMFTPIVDNRGELGFVTIHSTIEGVPYKKIPAELVRNVEDIVRYCAEHDEIGVVVLDEGHMYEGDHAGSIKELKKMGVHVFGTYLDNDFRARPFEMPNGTETTETIREAVADKHIALFAYCEEPRNGDVCGNFGDYSQRFLRDGRIAPLDTSTLGVGGKKGVDTEHEFSYRPVCRHCYVKPAATMAELDAMS